MTKFVEKSTKQLEGIEQREPPKEKNQRENAEIPKEYAQINAREPVHGHWLLQSTDAASINCLLSLWTTGNGRAPGIGARSLSWAFTGNLVGM